jgi:hypothetical protein
MERRIAAQTDGHPVLAIRMQIKDLQYLTELFFDTARFHYDPPSPRSVRMDTARQDNPFL